MEDQVNFARAMSGRGPPLLSPRAPDHRKVVVVVRACVFCARTCKLTQARCAHRNARIKRWRCACRTIGSTLTILLRQRGEEARFAATAPCPRTNPLTRFATCARGLETLWWPRLREPRTWARAIWWRF